MHMSGLAGRALAAVLLLSCGGDDGFNPTAETVAGSYHVTTLRETQNGITINQLALGVTLGLSSRRMEQPPGISLRRTAGPVVATWTPI